MLRLVSGVVLAAAAVAAVLFLPLWALQIVAACVSALAAHEYLRIVGTMGVVRQAVPIAATMAACVMVSRHWTISVPALMIVALAWLVVDMLATGRRVQEVAADLFAPVYVGAPLGMLVVIHQALGWRATLLLVGLVIVSDSAQYYTGRAFGRHALAPSISPKKTIEGAIGGLVAGAVFVVIAGSYALPDHEPVRLAVLGLVLVVAGICGDLFESRLKRLAGMKDSSSLIPGHGGVLDRIDALLFCSATFYTYLALFVMAVLW